MKKKLLYGFVVVTMMSWLIGCNAVRRAPDGTASGVAQAQIITIAPEGSKIRFVTATPGSPVVADPPVVDSNKDGQINMRDLDGMRFRLSEYRGKKVYIKFWASWCYYCTKGFPELEKMANDPARDFEVVTVVAPGYGSELSESEFRDWFAKQNHNNFRVLIDEGGELVEWYGIRAYPTSFFVAPDGTTQVFSGDLPNELIYRVFESDEMNVGL